MRLRLTDKCPNGYNGVTGSWLPGDEKNVDDAEGARLLGSFGDWFVRADAPAVKPIADGAPVTKPVQGKKK